MNQTLSSDRQVLFPEANHQQTPKPSHGHIPVDVEKLKIVALNLLTCQQPNAETFKAIADKCGVSKATVYRVRRGDKNRYLGESVAKSLRHKFPGAGKTPGIQYNDPARVEVIAKAILRQGYRKQNKILTRFRIGYKAMVAIRHGANPNISEATRAKLIARFGPYPKGPSDTVEPAPVVEETLPVIASFPPELNVPSASHMMDAIVMLAEVCVRMYNADEDFLRRFLRTSAQLDLPRLHSATRA